MIEMVGSIIQAPVRERNPFSGRDKGPDLRERLISRLLNKNQSSKVHFLDSTSDLTNASSPVARDHSEGYLSKFLRKALRSFPSSPSRASRVLFLTQFVSRLALEKPVEEAVTSRFDFQPLFEKGARARGLEQEQT